MIRRSRFEGSAPAAGSSISTALRILMLCLSQWATASCERPYTVEGLHKPPPRKCKSARKHGRFHACEDFTKASLPPPIPKGLCPPAQGCEQRATLGFGLESRWDSLSRFDLWAMLTLGGEVERAVRMSERYGKPAWGVQKLRCPGFTSLPANSRCHPPCPHHPTAPAHPARLPASSWHIGRP